MSLFDPTNLKRFLAAYPLWLTLVEMLLIGAVVWWVVRFLRGTRGARLLKGIAVVLISHSMPHVLEVANRIHVMRLGSRIATLPGRGTTVEELVGAMTGALDAKAAAGNGIEKEVAQ